MHPTPSAIVRPSASQESAPRPLRAPRAVKAQGATPPVLPVSVTYLCGTLVVSTYFVVLSDRRTYTVDKRHGNGARRVRMISSGRVVTLSPRTVAAIGNWIDRIEARS